VVAAVLTIGVYARVAGVPASAQPVSPVSGDMRDIRSPRAGLRVLFIGNSLTYYNAMTRMVHALAARAPGAEPIFTYQYAPGGHWLSQAVADPALWRLLNQVRWNYVVLQEDSHVSDYHSFAAQMSVPAGRELAALASRNGARTMVFETWGYRSGYDYVYPVDNYARMQERLQYSAQALGGALGAPVAPVGYAFTQAVAASPNLDLWQLDTSHPSESGSYLAAAVFFSLLDNRDPETSTYDAALPPSLARWLRSLAHVALATVEHGSEGLTLPPILDDPWAGADGNP
jgi:hypothetical protein